MKKDSVYTDLNKTTGHFGMLTSDDFVPAALCICHSRTKRHWSAQTQMAGFRRFRIDDDDDDTNSTQRLKNSQNNRNNNKSDGKTFSSAVEFRDSNGKTPLCEYLDNFGDDDDEEDDKTSLLKTTSSPIDGVVPYKDYSDSEEDELELFHLRR